MHIIIYKKAKNDLNDLNDYLYAKHLACGLHQSLPLGHTPQSAFRGRVPPEMKVAERSEVGRGSVTALLAVTSGRLQIAPTGIDILRS